MVIAVASYFVKGTYSTGQRQGIMQTRSARIHLWRQTRLSPETNAFISGEKHVCLRGQMHLSPEMNTFVSSERICPLL